MDVNEHERPFNITTRCMLVYFSTNKLLAHTCQCCSFLYGLSWLWPYGNFIYNYLCNQCLSPLTLWVWILLRRSVLDTSLCDKVCQWLEVRRWFSPSAPVSSTNKTGRHDITEILLKVALSTITLYPNAYICKLLTSISFRKPRSKWYHSSLLLHGILR